VHVVIVPIATDSTPTSASRTDETAFNLRSRPRRLIGRDLEGGPMATPETDDEFTAFVEARWSTLYRTAYLMVGEHGAAEDLVQTALSKAYVAWAKVRIAESAEAYVRKVLVNTALSTFRRRSSTERPTADLPETSGLHHGTEADRTWLIRELARLPQRQRTVVVLRFYEDLSVAETAAAMGCSEGTVKRQSHLALNKLRETLGPELVPMSERGAR